MSLGKKLPSVYTCMEGKQKAGEQSKFHFADPCQLLKNRDLECFIKENLKSDLGKSVPWRELSWWGMGQEQE